MSTNRKAGAGLAAAHGSAASTLSRIQNYLGNGGLFNPEMMEHEKVRDLLMDCRACIEAHHETIKWIASQQNLFFAECSQAEEIVSRCASLLNADLRQDAGSAASQPKETTNEK